MEFFITQVPMGVIPPYIIDSLILMLYSAAAPVYIKIHLPKTLVIIVI
jgi:hypothetical protein